MDAEKETVIRATMNADGYKKGMVDVASSTKATADSVVRDNERVVSSQEKVGRSVQEGSRAYNSVRAALDPYGAALQRAIDQQTKLNRQIELGRGTAEEHARLQLLAARGIEEAKTKYDAFNTALAAAASASQKSSAAAAAHAAELDKLRVKFDPLYAASKKYAEALDEITAAKEAGAISAKTAEAAQERETAAYAAANQPLREYTALLKQAAEGRREFAASQAQIAINRTLGVADQATGSARASAAVFEEQFRREEAAMREKLALQTQLTAQAKAWISVSDPIAASQVRVNEAIANGNTLLKAGLITQAQYSAGIAKVGEQSGTATWALRGMGIQAYDVVQQLASGAPILTTFIQQGGQVAQMAAISGVGFKELASAVGGFLLRALGAIVTPIGIVVTGLIALSGGLAVVISRAIGFVETSRALSVSLAAVGNSANISTKELQGYIKELERSGIASEEAVKAADTLARNTQLNSAQRQQVVSMIPDANTALGTSTAETQKLLTDAMLGNVDAVNKLDEALNFLTPSLKATVMESKDVTGALTAGATIMDVLKARILGLNSEALGPNGEAWRQIKNDFNAWVDSIVHSDFIDAIIRNWTSLIGNLLKAIRDLRGEGLDANIERLERESAEGGSGAFAQMFGFGKTPEARDREILRLKELKAQRESLAVTKEQTQQEQALARATANTSDVKTKQINDLARQRAETLGGISGTEADKYRKQIEAFQAQQAKLRETNSENTAEFHTLTKAISANEKALEDLSKSAEDYGPAYPSLLRQAQQRAATLPNERIEENKKYREELAALGVRTEANAQLFDIYTNAIAANDKAIASATKEHQTHRTSLEKAHDKIAAQIEAQKQLGAAYRAGGGDINMINAALKAQEQVISEGKLQPGMKGYAEAVAKATTANLELNEVTGVTNMDRQIDATNKATEAQIRISESWDGSAESLQHLQNLEAARALALANNLQPGQEAYNRTVEDYTAALDRGSAATKQFQDAQRSMEALSNILSNAFDRLGDALVQAFVGGKGQAVDFGNVFRGLVSSILSDLAKLAIINPILNDLMPLSSGPRPTLDSALAGFAGGGRGGGGGFLGNIGTLGTVGSAANTLSGGSLYGNIGSRLGLTGPNSLMSGFTGLMNTPVFSAAGGGLFPTFSSMGLSAGEISLLGSAGVASPTAGVAGAVGLGTALSGVGAGFGLGSMAGGYIQGALNKTGPAPTIGAAGGAVTGAIIGSVVPVIGTVLGGVIGGLLGGAGGGLIGPRPPSPYNYDTFGFNAATGGLQAGKSERQLMDSTAAITAASIDNFNSTLSNLGLSIETMTTRLGTVTPTTPGAGGQLGVGKEEGTSLVAANLQELISKFTFTSSNPDLARYLKGQSFPDQNALAAAVQQFQAIHKAIIDFLDGTVASLTKTQTVTGSLNDAIAQLGAQYDAAIQQAHALATNTAASADQVARLTQAEADLGIARAAAIERARQQVLDQLAATNREFDSRYMAAQAQVSGRPEDAQAASLFAFDLKADAERKQFTEQLRQTFGDAFLATQGYADQMASQERALGMERLAIQKAANDNLVDSYRNALAELETIDRGFDARFYTAQAQLTENPEDALKASLFSFDLQAKAERASFTEQLKASFGDAYVQTQGYVDQMASLERALGTERLVIQKAANDNLLREQQQAAEEAARQQEQASQSAAAVVSSIAEYLRKIQMGPESALAPQAQYDLASKQFNAVSGAAQAGDFESIQKLTDYADALINASRAVNGGGAQFAADFERVVSVIEKISQVPSDQLTASAFAFETRTASQANVQELQILQGLVRDLITEVRSGANRPLRATAA